MPTQITSAGITFNDATSLTSANGVPSAIKQTTARTINGVAFDGTANITVPASGTSAAKAWVNFDGTGAIGVNQLIRSSYNVSSVVKTGTGLFTINFPAAGLANSNYAATFGSIRTNNIGNISGAVTENNLIARTSSSIPIFVGDSSYGAIDAPYISLVVFAS